MDQFTDNLSVGSLITLVSDQLLQSQADRVAAGKSAVFEIKDLELEISFVVTTSEHGGGGFDLKVIKADAGLKYDTESVQKVTLKLSAVENKQPDGRFGPVRPRKPDDRP